MSLNSLGCILTCREEKPMLVKVLLADDVAAVRKLERRVLESESEIEVIGEAADAPEAVRLTGELKPDVIVMDLHMPGMVTR
jgi:chemotaxis response regulator CheB